ncbi:unnamed protein product, partial [Brenthis ino]
MISLWSLLILAIIVLEVLCSDDITTELLGDNVPLSKSLGFSRRNNYGRKLDESRLNSEYLELYNDMLKAGQEGVKKLEDIEDYIGTDLIKLKGMVDRRRSVRMQSAAGGRRARSQAIRREKLNNQSLKSHREHSLHSSVEQRLLI